MLKSRHSFAAGALVLAALGLFAPFALAQQPDYIWWEGERPAATNFPRTTHWPDGVVTERRGLLSARGWLTSHDPRPPGNGEELFARYDVTVPAAGKYQFWVRKFWQYGPFRWRFDDNDWQVCSKDAPLADSVELAQHVQVNWVKLGEVELAAGDHRFELRLLAAPGESTMAGIDAFVLTAGPFLPNGQAKPGERSGRPESGHFTFEPPLDGFADSPIDLRRLNETEAGQGGFVRREGERLVLANGHPVRFWAININHEIAGVDDVTLRYTARRIAKLGINMVRYHDSLAAAAPGDVTRLDARRLDDLHRTIAAFRREGIYTTISFFYPGAMKLPPELVENGSGGDASMHGLLFFNERLQELHRGWLKQLLTTPNPHTGRPLAAEPAVAIVEVVNEDSLLFWTLSPKMIPAAQWQSLEQRFGQWLAQRHGSVNKALAAWGGAREAGDDSAAGRAAILEAWHMTSDGLGQGGAAKRLRMADQARFLTELQRSFYETTVRYIKDDLGYGGLVSTGNWQTADPRLLDGLERYTYTAGDVIDRHGYFGGKHEGDAAGYAIRPGQTYEDRAAVKHPDELPLQVNQVAGYPHVISEIGWPNPNRYRADAMLLSAAYAGLQGIDGLMFFTMSSPFVRDTSMAKFSMTSPVISATSPAAALMYRRGDIAEGPVVYLDRTPLDDLFALKGGGVAAAGALDINRQRNLPAGASTSGGGGPSSLAFFTGKVVRTFGEPTELQVADAARFIRPDLSLVIAANKQVLLDYNRGVLTINAERVQGAAGFLATLGAVRLPNVAIECTNEYASIVAIALDDLPLADSRRILVQAMTEERPSRFRAKDGKILDVGNGPFQIRRIEATVTLTTSGSDGVRVTALDPNGYSMGEVEPLARDPLRLRLKDDAIYHLIEREK